MGNGLSPCVFGTSRSVKLIFFDGEIRTIKGERRTVAGEIMFEFPDRIVCHAGSFFIGRPLPALEMADPLLPGETYFVLPVDRFACGAVLSASSLAAFRARTGGPKASPPLDFGSAPFEYVKWGDRVLIKVSPEFIAKLILGNGGEKGAGTTGSGGGSSPAAGFLCSTPELQKHYDQLVGAAKVQEWSPKLETVPEYKRRISPCRCMGREGGD